MSAALHQRCANAIAWANARQATKTGIAVTAEEDGFRFQFSPDPLDFVWQTEDQVTDLLMDIATVALELTKAKSNGR